MKHFILLSIFFISLLGCEKESVIITSCIDDVKVKELDCCQIEYADINRNCKNIYVGAFDLLDTSLNYLPIYCREIGDTIIYTNQDSSELLFEIYKKSYFEIYGQFGLDIACENNTNVEIGACAILEDATVGIRDTTNKFYFSLSLQSSFDLESFPEEILLADFLTINHNIVPGFLPYSISFTISNRGFPVSRTSPEIHFEEIMLNNKIYYDVRTNVKTPQDVNKYKIYYSKEYGLIGFEDDNSTLWTLKNY